MSDNLNLRGTPDRSRINVNEPYELAYWTTTWKVTEQQLRDAVKAVGVMADDVKRHLGK